MIEAESRWAQIAARLRAASFCPEEVFDRQTIDHLVRFIDRISLSQVTCMRAVVASRLGHDPARRRFVALQLAASAREMSAAGETLLVAQTTAIEPLAIHAAQTFGVPVLRLVSPTKAGDGCADNEIVLAAEMRSRFDEIVIAFADRVDVAYARHSGRIHQLVQQRLRHDDLSARVGIDPSVTDPKAVASLLESGAVGRFQVPVHPKKKKTHSHRMLEVDSLNHDEWLIHCTRSRPGPWPGQTERQYLDDLLLGDDEAVAREPIDALKRVLTMQRLIAGAVTSNKRAKVVCFSGVPLRELLSRRTYRSHVHRWDYEPVGLAIRKSAAIGMGVKPAFYGQPEERARLPQDQRYRFVAVGKTHDWRLEKEWRSLGDVDLSQIADDDLRVFVPSKQVAGELPLRNGRSLDVVVVKAQTLTSM